MSMAIKNHSTNPYQQQQDLNSNKSFNDLVLDHIKDNRPDGSLSELLDELKQLSPDNSCSSAQLTIALQYSDTILRNDSDYQDYTTEILDKRAIQLMGVNMLVQKMQNSMHEVYEMDDDLF